MTYDLRRIKRAVTNLVKAEIDNSWKGGGDPQDIPEIEQRLKLARKNFNHQCAILERHLAAGGDRPDLRGLG